MQSSGPQSHGRGSGHEPGTRGRTLPGTHPYPQCSVVTKHHFLKKPTADLMGHGQRHRNTISPLKPKPIDLRLMSKVKGRAGPRQR